jgi:hypothetical protein
MRAANHAALYFKRRVGNRVRPTLPRAPHPATAPLHAAVLQPPGLQRRCSADARRLASCAPRSCSAHVQRWRRGAGGDAGSCRRHAVVCRLMPPAVRCSLLSRSLNWELGSGPAGLCVNLNCTLSTFHFMLQQSQATGCKGSSNEAPAPPPAHSSALHKTALTTAPDDCTAA